MQSAKAGVKRTHFIEMAGIAGSGKSSLLATMMQRNTKIRTPSLPRKAFYLPFLIRTASRWLPRYVLKYRDSRWFTLQEVRNMGYLDTWQKFIQRKDKGEGNIFVIEPGSIYWYSSLEEYGPEVCKCDKYQSWLRDSFKRWASSLDLLIWLDAPEGLCLQRVMARDQWHEAKSMTTDLALKELKCFRECYARIIPEIASQYSLKLLTFRTDQISTREMADIVFMEIDRWQN